MTQITQAARVQSHATLADYLHPSRSWVTAAENFAAAYQEATVEIGESPHVGAAHPPRYATLAGHGYLWRKFGIYWFSFIPIGRLGLPVITNIVNQRNLDGVISRDEEPIDDA